MADVSLLAVKNRVPFPLGKDHALRALVPLRIFIPAQILDPPGTPLSRIIRLSNEQADISLVESPAEAGKIAAIVVMMRPRDEICLGRSAEVLVDDVPDGKTAFETVEN